MKKTEITTEGTLSALKGRSAVRLLSMFVVGSTLASPSSLRSATALSGSPMHLNSEQKNAASKGGQAAAKQAPAAAEEERGGNRPGLRSGPPKNGNEKPQGKRDRPVRPPRPDVPRPPAHHHHPHYGYGYPHYVWGYGNGWRLHQYFYEDMRRGRWMHRRPILVGGYLSPMILANLQPIPDELMAYLPPVPPGYEAGYFRGYCVVYDQFTLRVISVIDLNQY